jgi:hypothetical protein
MEGQMQPNAGQLGQSPRAGERAKDVGSSKLTQVNQNLLRFDLHQLVHYVNSTRNDDGGYCFYRLDESNAADTFYAVYALTALNQPVAMHNRTRAYLRQRQGSDGSFQSVFAADYVLRGLARLAAAPLFDPDDFLLARLQASLDIVRQPRYERSEAFLELLGTAVELVSLRKAALLRPLEADIAAAVQPYKRPEGGFGTERASVFATYHALRALTCSRSELFGGVSSWIRECEWPTGGFSQTRANTPNYLDAIYQGLSVMRAVNARPRYPQQTAQFIARLQNANGGFRRAADVGISSLENTYYAIRALVELSYWIG